MLFLAVSFYQVIYSLHSRFNKVANMLPIKRLNFFYSLGLHWFSSLYYCIVFFFLCFYFLLICTLIILLLNSLSRLFCFVLFVYILSLYYLYCISPCMIIVLHCSIMWVATPRMPPCGTNKGSLILSYVIQKNKWQPIRMPQ